MKLLHLSDLHIGKKVYGYAMLEEQKEVLNQILRLCEIENPDVVLITGDIYDRPIPGEEAILTMDYFLTELNRKKIEVFLISGNHDSGERLQFGKEIMEQRGIHIVGTFKGQLETVHLSDKWGTVHFFMLPFVKLSIMKKYDRNAQSLEEAIQNLIQHTSIVESERNVLLAHQFVVNGSRMPECCDSEILPVGGLECIDCEVFDPFDYVALGHLHRAQKIERESIRYAGSPLKYSFSEVMHKKSVVFVELREKHEMEWKLIPLKPIHEMRELRGKLNDFVQGDDLQNVDREDYIKVILTDEEELYRPFDQLRCIFPNMLRLDFENSRTEIEEKESVIEHFERRTEMELFEQFFEKQNQMELTEEQKKYVQKYLKCL